MHDQHCCDPAGPAQPSFSKSYFGQACLTPSTPSANSTTPWRRPATASSAAPCGTNSCKLWRTIWCPNEPDGLPPRRADPKLTPCSIDGGQNMRIFHTETNTTFSPNIGEPLENRALN